MELIRIGTIHTAYSQAQGTPIQPARAGSTSVGRIVLDERYVDGLKDLEGFDRIWILYWFDRAKSTMVRVVPYRDVIEHGIFATRVPPRPNPIGMSNVKLVGIDGNVLHVAEIDVLDGTPLIDIKPYVPQYDNYPAERCGWLDQVPDKPVVADGRFEKSQP